MDLATLRYARARTGQKQSQVVSSSAKKNKEHFQYDYPISPKFETPKNWEFWENIKLYYESHKFIENISKRMA